VKESIPMKAVLAVLLTARLRRSDEFRAANPARPR
jgi:hypothetical protein